MLLKQSKIEQVLLIEVITISLKILADVVERVEIYRGLFQIKARQTRCWGVVPKVREHLKVVLDKIRKALEIHTT